MRKKRQYIVLSFASTARAMGWEKECAARGIPGRIIPLPGEITAGCGPRLADAAGGLGGLDPPAGRCRLRRRNAGHAIKLHKEKFYVDS